MVKRIGRNAANGRLNLGLDLHRPNKTLGEVSFSAQSRLLSKGAKTALS